MKNKNEILNNEFESMNTDDSEVFYKTDSIFMGINIAGLRHRQLKQGAHSRLTPNPLKHKNTIVAVEEVKQGLIAFRFVKDPLV